MIRRVPGETTYRALRLRLPSVAFASLRGYQREWASADALAALALLVIVVPEQLATSRLAGMPPIAGFYAFVAGTAMFALLGSSPQMSVGADSTIAPLFAVGIAGLAPTGSDRYIELVAILAVLVGVIVALVGLLNLGWLAEFLSAPIIAGFLGGVAVIIVVHQLPDLLGLAGQGGSIVHRIGVIATHLDQTNGWALGIGLGVIALVLLANRIDRRIPGTLLGLVGSTVLVSAVALRGDGVVVLGSFHHGLPHPGLAGLSFSSLRSVAPLAAAVALVVVTQSAVTTRAFADQGGYEVDVSRDFLGVGAGSIVAGLAGSFPVNGSPPRTGAVAAAGGRTQAAGLAAVAGVAVLIPAAGLLTDLPVATLAAVLLFIAAKIFPLEDLRAIARFDLFEFALAMVTLIAVAFIGVEQGIAVAVGLAILDRTRLSARPQLHVLGRIPGTTSWAPLSSAENAAQVPSVLVVLFATPLWYANAVHFHAQIDAALKRALGPPNVVVLDAIGMTDIDYTGARVLQAVLDEFDRTHIAFAVARAGERVRTGLDRCGLLERIGPDHFFSSVNEAVIGMRG